MRGLESVISEPFSRKLVLCWPRFHFPCHTNPSKSRPTIGVDTTAGFFPPTVHPDRLLGWPGRSCGKRIIYRGLNSLEKNLGSPFQHDIFTPVYIEIYSLVISDQLPVVIGICVAIFGLCVMAAIIIFLVW